MKIFFPFLLGVLISSSLLLAQSDNKQDTGCRLEDRLETEGYRLEMPLQRQEMEDRRWKMEVEAQDCSFQKAEGRVMNENEHNAFDYQSSLLANDFVPISHLPSSISYLGVTPKLMMDPVSTESAEEAIEKLILGETRLPRALESHDSGTVVREENTAAVSLPHTTTSVATNECDNTSSNASKNHDVTTIDIKGIVIDLVLLNQIKDLTSKKEEYENLSETILKEAKKINLIFTPILDSWETFKDQKEAFYQQIDAKADEAIAQINPRSPIALEQEKVIQDNQQLIRPLSKLASADEVQGVDGAQKLSVQELLDASSTGATQQFAAEVEVGKKSIKDKIFLLDQLKISQEILNIAIQYKNKFANAFLDAEDPALKRFYYKNLDSINNNIEKLESAAESILNSAKNIINNQAEKRICRDYDRAFYITSSIAFEGKSIAHYVQFAESLKHGDSRLARYHFKLGAYYKNRAKIENINTSDYVPMSYNDFVDTPYKITYADDACNRAIDSWERRMQAQTSGDLNGLSFWDQNVEYNQFLAEYFQKKVGACIQGNKEKMDLFDDSIIFEHMSLSQLEEAPRYFDKFQQVDEEWNWYHYEPDEFKEADFWQKLAQQSQLFIKYSQKMIQARFEAGKKEIIYYNQAEKAIESGIHLLQEASKILEESSKENNVSEKDTSVLEFWQKLAQKNQLLAEHYQKYVEAIIQKNTEEVNCFNQANNSAESCASYLKRAFNSLEKSREAYRENNRPLSKLAYADEVQGVDGAQKLSVQELLDASSTGATKQFAAEVEFGKKSNESLGVLWHENAIQYEAAAECYRLSIEACFQKNEQETEGLRKQGEELVKKAAEMEQSHNL